MIAIIGQIVKILYKIAKALPIIDLNNDIEHLESLINDEIDRKREMAQRLKELM